MDMLSVTDQIKEAIHPLLARIVALEEETQKLKVEVASLKPNYLKPRAGTKPDGEVKNLHVKTEGKANGKSQSKDHGMRREGDGAQDKDETKAQKPPQRIPTSAKPPPTPHKDDVKDPKAPVRPNTSAAGRKPVDATKPVKPTDAKVEQAGKKTEKEEKEHHSDEKKADVPQKVEPSKSFNSLQNQKSPVISKHKPADKPADKPAEKPHIKYAEKPHDQTKPISGGKKTGKSEEAAKPKPKPAKEELVTDDAKKEEEKNCTEQMEQSQTKPVQPVEVVSEQLLDQCEESTVKQSEVKVDLDLGTHAQTHEESHEQTHEESHEETHTQTNGQAHEQSHVDVAAEVAVAVQEESL